MTYTSWQAIANTPWWVFAIFFYLFRIGFLATKGQIISIHSLFILPAIFIPLSFFSLYATVQITIPSTFFWSGASIVGMLFGCLQFRILKITAIKDKNKLHVPGSWSLLILFILIFIGKYYFDITTIDSELLTQPKFATGLLVLYGFLSGIFVGRAIWGLRCLKLGPYFSAPQ